MSNEQQSGKMWSGRFREPLDKEFEAVAALDCL